MTPDQWVPCSPEWLEKYPNACADAPRRPGRQGENVSHYHHEDNPTIEELANFRRVPLPSYKPQQY